MKTFIKGLVALVVLAAGSGGIYAYIESDKVDPSSLLGSSYWGEFCGLSPTGFLICKNTSENRFDKCVAEDSTYRLKVSVVEPMYSPISLEIWTENPRSYKQLTSTEIYDDGDGRCYYQGYRFSDLDIQIHRAMPCGNHISSLEDPFLMFHVTYRDKPPVACRISETPEAIDTN